MRDYLRQTQEVIGNREAVQSSATKQLEMKMRNSIVLVCLVPGFALAQSPPQGEWEAPFDFGPSSTDRIVAIDLIHVFDSVEGKFLALTSEWPSGTPTCWAGFSRLWTPPPMGSPSGDPGTFEDVEFCGHRLFCGGHSALANGQVLHVGGNSSTNPLYDAEMFHPEIPPSAAAWNYICQAMTYNRWYPTCTTLPDGRILVSDGTVNGVQVERIEVYHPDDPTTQPCDDYWDELPSSADRVWERTYPYIFVLPRQYRGRESPGVGHPGYHNVDMGTHHRKAYPYGRSAQPEFGGDVRAWEDRGFGRE